jgi:hypothetical protein
LRILISVIVRKPITIHLSASETIPIPDTNFHTLEALNASCTLSELEPTHENIFEDDYIYYAFVDFINPSGNIVQTLYKEIQKWAVQESFPSIMKP